MRLEQDLGAEQAGHLCRNLLPGDSMPQLLSPSLAVLPCLLMMRDFWPVFSGKVAWKYWSFTGWGYFWGLVSEVQLLIS